MLRPSTVVVLLDAFVARADLRWRRGRCEVAQAWRLPRGTEAAGERLDQMLAVAPWRGELLVLSDELFLQPIELSSRAIAGLSARDLAAAVALEAQSYSGLGADVATSWLRPGGDRHFVVAQASRGDLANFAEVAERSGGRLLGLAHPGAMPSALREAGQQFVRLEEWSGQRLMVRGRNGALERVRAWTGSGAAQSGPETPTEHLVARPAPTLGDGVATFELGQDEVLQQWLARWAEAVAHGADVLLLVAPEPAAVRNRRILFAAIALVLVAVLAWLDRNQLQQTLLATHANVVASRAPIDRLQSLEAEVRALEQQLATPVVTAPAAAPVTPWSTATVVTMLDAVARCRPAGTVVDGLQLGWQGCRIRGLADDPVAVDRFAAALVPALRDAGYLVQPGNREALAVPGGVLSSFELDLMAFAAAAPLPVAPSEDR